MEATSSIKGVSKIFYLKNFCERYYIDGRPVKGFLSIEGLWKAIDDLWKIVVYRRSVKGFMSIEDLWKHLCLKRACGRAPVNK